MLAQIIKLATQLAADAHLPIATLIGDTSSGFITSIAICDPAVGGSGWPIGSTMKMLTPATIQSDLEAQHRRHGLQNFVFQVCVFKDMLEKAGGVGAPRLMIGRPREKKKVALLVRVGARQNFDLIGQSQYKSTGDGCAAPCHRRCYCSGRTALHALTSVVGVRSHEVIELPEELIVSTFDSADFDLQKYLEKIYELIKTHFDSSAGAHNYGIPTAADYSPNDLSVFGWKNTPGMTNSRVLFLIEAPARGCPPVSQQCIRMIYDLIYDDQLTDL